MNHLLQLLGFGLLVFAAASVEATTYVVKKGDTLASIARTRYGEPVFGPKGTIKKILKLNPGLKLSASLEPGQKIELENNLASYPDEKAPAAAVPPVKVPPEVTAPVAETPKVEEAQLPPIQPPPAPVPTAPLPPPPREVVRENHDPCPAVTSPVAQPEHPQNHFSVVANYSMVTQTAKEDATGTSYTLHSSPAWGAEVGWDHWWNDSFSTILSYSMLQLTSEEHELNGAKVLNNVSLGHAELALLNRVASWVRFGLGGDYGDHIFLEQFSATPPNPTVYRMSFLSPFFMAQFTAHESPGFEWLVDVKASYLPAETISGHEVMPGVEYLGQISLEEKFARFSMLYGLSYSTENQSRTDASEVSRELALKVGALF